MLSHLNISNVALDRKIKSLKGTENEIQAEIIRYLSELDSRKAYRDLGYSSLFTYCTEALGYSKGAAYRRVEAVRTYQTNPEIYESVKSGKLSVCAVAEVSKIKDTEVKTEVLKASEGKTKEEVKLLTAVHLPPETKQKRDIIKPVLKEAEVSAPLFDAFNDESIKAYKLEYKFSVELDEECMRLYEEARELVGHTKACEVLKRVLREFVAKRKEVKRQVVTDCSRKSRFIPKATKLVVLKRDGRCCSFVSKDGKRCQERHGLEFDHIVPFSKGGSRDSSNLRLVCRAHNQLYAERYFGKDFMKGKVLAGKRVRTP